jgi:hypothetical protein
MSCTHELIKGLVQVNAGIAGSGSAVNIESLFPVGGPFESFDEITVFNDTDRPIQVAWTNDSTSKYGFLLCSPWRKKLYPSVKQRRHTVYFFKSVFVRWYNRHRKHYHQFSKEP